MCSQTETRCGLLGVLNSLSLTIYASALEVPFNVIPGMRGGGPFSVRVGENLAYIFFVHTGAVRLFFALLNFSISIDSFEAEEEHPAYNTGARL